MAAAATAGYPAAGGGKGYTGDFPTSTDQLDFVRRLGRGYFGEVWQAREKLPSGRTFAVKKVPLELIRKNRLMDQMEREVDILRSLNHRNIVRFYFDFRTADHIFLGMEFVEGGVLFDALKAAQRFEPSIAARYFKEVCDALEYLHGLPQKVIHRDIKPENILVDKDGHAKLADFGWANLLVQDSEALLETFCGTLDYLSPEMLQGSGHDESLDMWSMGVLLYELLTGKSPFGAKTLEETKKLILALRFRRPKDMDRDAQDLITALCRLVPRERLSARDAKKHAFVQRHLADGDGSLVIADDGLTSRPSVEARGLRKENELLEGEKLQVLKAKAAQDEKLLQVTDEMKDLRAELQLQQRLRIVAEAKAADLEAEIAARDREIEALRREAEERKRF